MFKLMFKNKRTMGILLILAGIAFFCLSLLFSYPESDSAVFTVTSKTSSFIEKLHAREVFLFYERDDKTNWYNAYKGKIIAIPLEWALFTSILIILTGIGFVSLTKK